MPLFFILSGMFISTKYTLSTYVKRKFSQLITPYIFTCCCVCIGAVLLDLISGKLSSVGLDLRKWIFSSMYGSGNLEPWGIRRIGAIWFLLALFFASFIVRAICKQRYAIAITFVAGLFGLGYLTSSVIWLPLSIQAGMCASIFVYAGYLFTQKYVTCQPLPWYMNLFIFIIWCTATIFSDMNMARNYYSNIPLNILGAFCATYLILISCKVVSEKEELRVPSRILAFYGRYSLIILCCHLIELNLFPWSSFDNFMLKLNIDKQLVIFSKLILKISYVTVSVFLVKRMNFLKRIFFGKKY